MRLFLPKRKPFHRTAQKRPARSLSAISMRWPVRRTKTGMTQSLRQRLRELYEGPKAASDRFRCGLMVFDLVWSASLSRRSFSENRTADILIGALHGLPPRAQHPR